MFIVCFPYYFDVFSCQLSFSPGSAVIDKKSFLEYVDENWQTIPSLNDPGCTRESCKNRVVRCRVLVQDILDKEFYNGAVEEVGPSGNRRTVCTKYQDSIQCSTPGGYLDFDSPASVISERQPVVCVTIPGESAWVEGALAEGSRGVALPAVNVNKRSLGGSGRANGDYGGEPAHALAAGGDASSEPGLCVVKLYSDTDSIFAPDSLKISNSSEVGGDGDGDGDYSRQVKLLDMVEVVGIYTVADTDPDAGSHGHTNKAMRVDESVGCSTATRTTAADINNGQHSSGASASASAPRPLAHIHCLHAKKCGASFPLTPSAPLCNNPPMRALLVDYISASLFAPVVEGAAASLLPVRNAPNADADTTGGKWLQDVRFISELVLLSLLSDSSAGVTTDETGASGLSDMILGYLPLNLVLGGAAPSGKHMWERLCSCVAELMPRRICIDRLDTHLFEATEGTSGPVSGSVSGPVSGSSSSANTVPGGGGGAEVEPRKFFSSYAADLGCDVEDFGMDVDTAEAAVDPTDTLARRCTPSLLQAGTGTVCLINELDMRAGALAPHGEMSLRALRTFCNRQQATVQYNEFTTLSLPVSHPVLSLSSARSVLLEEPYVHPVYIADYSALCAAGVGTALASVDAKELLAAKMYLLGAASLNTSGPSSAQISMSPAVVEAAECFFLQCRQGQGQAQTKCGAISEESVKADAVSWFNFCLTIVRLIACSHHQTEIDIEHWGEMLQLTTWYDNNFSVYKGTPMNSKSKS